LKGYSEANLRRAWADAKNADIAASIIGSVLRALISMCASVQPAFRRIQF
jgi:hypothetical protein